LSCFLCSNETLFSAKGSNVFTLTFIDKAGKLHSISSPTRNTVVRLFRLVRLNGSAARVWHNGARLVF
jgi:hypothetical protein